MPKIKILKLDTIEKIAAGEVIDRPEACVKELVENSIDAGAKNITIEIENMGLSSIKIIDDGSGLDREDLILATTLHATSKISQIEDLENINTFGFRGEALASIARISNMEIKSRISNNDFGYKINIKTGNCDENVEKVGMPFGTQILIKDLFFNVPARKKFLKSKNVEIAKIIDIIEKIAISYDKIKFILKIDGKIKLNFFSKEGKISRIKEVFGKTLENKLIPFEFQNEQFHISGYTSTNEYRSTKKNNYYVFVNNRIVNSKIINIAINNAYKEILVTSVYPITFLFLEMSGEYFDCNIHPRKLDVRFLNESAIYSIVSETIKSSLKDKDVQNVIKKSCEDTLSTEKFFNSKNFDNDTQKVYEFENNNKKLKLDIFSEKNFKNYKTKIYFPNEYKEKYLKSWQNLNNIFNNIDLKEEKKLKIIENKTSQGNLQIEYKKEDENLKVIGFFPEKYILAFNKANDLVLIDEHAADERINFEKLLDDYKNKKVLSKGLLFPVEIEVPFSIMEKYKNLDIYKKIEIFGYYLEPFGKNIIKINAVPNIIDTGKEKTASTEILDIFSSDIDINNIPNTTVEKIMMTSCKNSIKAKTILSMEEMKNLIKKLFLTKNPYHCPHGRPTMISFSQKEMDKKFFRII